MACGLLAVASAGRAQAPAFMAKSNSAVDTNICGINWNYCPRDPGCATYTMSVHKVTARDTSTQGPVLVKDVKIGDKITVDIQGKTTLKAVPTQGSYRVYSLQGKNVAAGTLGSALKLNGDNFEFGIDIFQKGSGSDEGMCVEVASDAYITMEKA